MQHFSTRIAITHGFNPEFSFYRIFTVNGSRFHISVMDQERKHYYFNMDEKHGQWKIINAPKVPDWIMGVEKHLEQAIIDNMNA